MRRWADETPDGFTFDVKLHRALSRHAAAENSLPPDAEATLGWYAARGAAWVATDAPHSDKHPTIMPPLDAVTRPDLAYLRAHDRNLEGYTRGGGVAERFA